jgi:hypothetical protein
MVSKLAEHSRLPHPIPLRISETSAMNCSLPLPHRFSLLGPPLILGTSAMNGILTRVSFPSSVPPRLTETDTINGGQCSPTTPSTPSATTTKGTDHGTSGSKQVELGCTQLRILPVASPYTGASRRWPVHTQLRYWFWWRLYRFQRQWQGSSSSQLSSSSPAAEASFIAGPFSSATATSRLHI